MNAIITLRDHLSASDSAKTTTTTTTTTTTSGPPPAAAGLPHPTATTPALHSEQLPPSPSPRESELQKTITRIEHALTQHVLADEKRQRELEDAWGRVEALLRILEVQQKERERLVGVVESLEALVVRGLAAGREVEEIESKQIAAATPPTELPASTTSTTSTSTTTVQVPSPLSPACAPTTPSNDPALQENNLVLGALSSTKNTTTTVNKPNIQQTPPRPTTQLHQENGKQQHCQQTPAQQRNMIDRSAIQLPPGMSKRQRKNTRWWIRVAPEAQVEKVVARI